MMRNRQCPVCETETGLVLQLHFNAKLKLPTQVEIRHCAFDNFLFVANGDQDDYDEYYRSLANDSYHAELAGANLHSPISMLQKVHIERLLSDFFDRPRRVLDFGCGEASLLVELASKFSNSLFFGFDPGPGAQIGSQKASKLGLTNLKITDLKSDSARNSYDLVIASHVIEHLLDFDLFHKLSDLLTEDGLLYIEVPNSLQYEFKSRREFLYYFDRLHVNHFTPQALTRLCATYGFGYVGHFEYEFPYRDGGKYPGLGMLFRKGNGAVDLPSPSLLDAANRYIAQEKLRVKTVARQFDKFEGVLVWGAGDNFFRSAENGGPLSGALSMVVLDRRPQEIVIGDRRWTTDNPEEGIRRLPWPVVITVSEGRKSIREKVEQIDPSREVFFV
jgi:2-polyprenyl-3-methyl-5-hydroxy-6-metoxy-1,4-benzoquinol methylase